MADYINVPTLNIDFLKPSRMRFHVPGSGIDGARNGLGQSISIEMTGGGIVTGAYEGCFVQAPEEHEYTNWIDALMSGSFRFMNVPIKSDWSGPFPLVGGIPTPIISGIPHSDGSLFSDGAGYIQATVFGTIAANAALNAGQITINIFGNSRNLRWSDWFAIRHSVKGWRAYRYWQASDPVAITETVDGVEYTGQQYTLGITPALRQAVTAGMRIEFARPRFVARFPSGFSSPWEVEGFYRANPSFQFVEAF